MIDDFFFFFSKFLTISVTKYIHTHLHIYVHTRIFLRSVKTYPSPEENSLIYIYVCTNIYVQ